MITLGSLYTNVIEWVYIPHMGCIVVERVYVANVIEWVYHNDHLRKSVCSKYVIAWVYMDDHLRKSVYKCWIEWVYMDESPVAKSGLQMLLNEYI